MLNVSSAGCNNEWQSSVKLSYSTIAYVLTNLLIAGLQDFFQVLNISKAILQSYCEYSTPPVFWDTV